MISAVAMGSNGSVAAGNASALRMRRPAACLDSSSGAGGTGFFSGFLARGHFCPVAESGARNVPVSASFGDRYVGDAEVGGEFDSGC